jgi:hypothetical protein
MTTRDAATHATDDLRTEALRALQVDPDLIGRNDERFLVRELLGSAARVVIGEAPPLLIEEYRLCPETMLLLRAVTGALRSLAVSPPAWTSDGTLTQRAAILASVSLIERAAGLERRARQ